MWPVDVTNSNDLSVYLVHTSIEVSCLKNIPIIMMYMVDGCIGTLIFLLHPKVSVNFQLVFRTRASNARGALNLHFSTKFSVMG